MEFSNEQIERLLEAWRRVQMSRRELDALIGDHYLAPRVNIVGVHFNSLAAAVEKLRWAEKEWLELWLEVNPQQQEAGEA